MVSTVLLWNCLDVVLNVLIFFNYTATTEIYTLSLHDALPICAAGGSGGQSDDVFKQREQLGGAGSLDRKSTRLNSSHLGHLVCRLLLEKKNDAVVCVDHVVVFEAALHSEDARRCPNTTLFQSNGSPMPLGACSPGNLCFFFFFKATAPPPISPFPPPPLPRI